MKHLDLLPEQSREDLKFLVEHFRKLALDKDQVIETYRDFLEKLKPFVEREQAHQEKYRFFYQEIRKLKDELEELTRKLPKKLNKKNP